MSKIDGYHFGNKNNWRRWSWNQIQERLTVPRKNALIAYLAGIEDLDRQAAVFRGFDPNNLIAIDHSGVVAQAIRKKGGLSLRGDAVQMLSGFIGASRKVDVFIGDFCAGLNENARRMLRLLACPVGSPFNEGAVVALNFMRGRDRGPLLDEGAVLSKGKTKHRGEMFFEVLLSRYANELLHRGDRSTEIQRDNEFRDYMDKAWAEAKQTREHMLRTLKEELVKAGRIRRDRAPSHNLRQFDVYTREAQKIFREFEENFCELREHICDPNRPPRFVGTEDYNAWDVRYLRRRMMPSFNQYHSGHIVMDSVVFNHCPFELGMFLEREPNLYGVSSDQQRRARNSVRAMLAVRTMRGTGYFSRSPGR